MFTQTPRLTFSGTVDLLVVDELADDTVAVIREALSNVARHAEATVVAVSVAVRDGAIDVRVTDDGIGIMASERSSGLANMTVRAERWQGTMEAARQPDGGTLVHWSARLTDLHQPDLRQPEVPA
jgi:signal transduction histidine kinase